ncbi:DMT family transporter [Afifella sp. YEN Y35]|uniref:DMT family transporter n=1 Tax=Afifella sp. YEN Y35 TaxID=3388337 RepID=UPI0039DFD51B
MQASSNRLRDITLLALMPLFFSSNLVIGRAAVSTVEPFTLAFLRWTVALLLLLPLAAAGLRQHRKTLLENWRLLLVLGFLGMGVCGAIVYLALRHTNATNATLIYTSSGVMILVLEWLFRGKRIALRQALGVALAFIGVAVIVLRGDLSRLIALELNAGDLLIALCAFSWAVYSVLLRRGSLHTVPTLPLFTAIVAAGAVVLLPFFAVEAVVREAFPSTFAAWLSIAGLAFISSVLAFLAYQHGVKVFGPGVTGMFLYLLPPYGVLLAMIFLGEEFHTYHALGLALVLPGLMLATLPSTWPRPWHGIRRWAKARHTGLS